MGKGRTYRARGRAFGNERPRDHRPGDVPVSGAPVPIVPSSSQLARMSTSVPGTSSCGECPNVRQDLGAPVRAQPREAAGGLRDDQRVLRPVDEQGRRLQVLDELVVAVGPAQLPDQRADGLPEGVGGPRHVLPRPRHVDHGGPCLGRDAVRVSAHQRQIVVDDGSRVALDLTAGEPRTDQGKQEGDEPERGRPVDRHTPGVGLAGADEHEPVHERGRRTGHEQSEQTAERGAEEHDGLLEVLVEEPDEHVAVRPQVACPPRRWGVAVPDEVDRVHVRDPAQRPGDGREVRVRPADAVDEQDRPTLATVVDEVNGPVEIDGAGVRGFGAHGSTL